MPFGGGFVLDGAQFAALQISPALTRLLAGLGQAEPTAPGLAEELRTGLDEGWLLHQEDA
jgi:hypothetical protein